MLESMSAPAPIREDPATAEAIAVATVGAERRLWLLELMTGFCMALLEAFRPGGAGEALLGLAHGKAFAAVMRGARLCISLEMETHLLLRNLRAGILPAPKAPRTAPKTSTGSDEGEDLDEGQSLDREFRPYIERDDDTGFRARLEDLEAVLHEEGHADWTLGETVKRLCRVLNLRPEWSGWLGDAWLEENLNAPLRQLLAETRAARRSAPPPTPILSPPAGRAIACES